MKIGAADFVLEIGSGHNPRARSDVLCDKFIGDDAQRGGAIVADRPLVAADGEYLPFVDKAFDYVICAHVLEHVSDPVRFISELERVAGRGYIETPSEIGERIYGWPYHEWVVNCVEGRLVLRRNEKGAGFGQLFHRFAATDKEWQRFHLSHHDLFLVRYAWEGRIDYEIVPDGESVLDLECPETLARLMVSAGGRGAWLKSLVPRGVVSRAKSLLVRGRRGQQKSLAEILACPVCKGGLRSETAGFRCESCERTYPIIDGIPRFTSEG